MRTGSLTSDRYKVVGNPEDRQPHLGQVQGDRQPREQAANTSDRHRVVIGNHEDRQPHLGQVQGDRQPRGQATSIITDPSVQVYL